MHAIMLTTTSCAATPHGQVERGVWNRVQIRVRLNTPGRADGIAGLGVNGHYRQFDRMVWRTHPDTRITEVRQGVCACWFFVLLSPGEARGCRRMPLARNSHEACRL